MLFMIMNARFQNEKLKKNNKKTTHIFNHYYTFLPGNSVEKLNEE